MTAALVHRVDKPAPITTLAGYLKARGGRGLDAARALDPAAIIQVIADSGLRGRGGAGFPTARKWATVASFHSDELPTTIVINAAEGEPGTYKDRHILTTNPYEVIEGALIASMAVGRRASCSVSRARRPR